MSTPIRLWLSVAIALATCPPLSAQTREGIDILLSKARSLETRGRMDLAAQNWNQVLLVDPNQTEALQGLARLAKQNGDGEALRGYLERLRKINPNDPAIDAIEKSHVLTTQELKLLDDAGRLAAERKPDEAMAIYRRVFGDAPPPGKWAGAFYETEAASTDGRAKAIAQLRDRSSRDPANEVYRLWLARLLTYDPKTRSEGLRLLESIGDAGAVDQARSAWRQALVWEKDNPEARPSLEAYVRRYPDRELQNSLNEQQGFRALREKDLGTAQARFEEAVRQTPNDVNALVGLGSVRLGQKRFDQALAAFTRAHDLAPERADVTEGYNTALFWLAMQRGAALQARQPDAALAAYEEAAALRPGNEQALLAIAQMMQQRGNLADAQAKFEQVVRTSPNSVDALVGLAFLRLTQKNFDAAVSLFARAQALDPRRREVEDGYRQARFWSLVQQGSAALAQNRTDAAIGYFKSALAIDARGKDALAGLAEANRRKGNRAEALDAYRQLTVAFPAEAGGWLGFMRSAIDSNDPRAALEIAQSIPASVRPQLDAHPEYLARMAQALFGANQLADGDRALRASLEAAARSDSEEALGARLDVATLLMNQGQEANAVLIYKQAVGAHPDNTNAWEGLIGAYSRMRDFSNAMTALRSMPRASFEPATTRVGFLSTLAGVYAAQGFCVEAEGLLTRAIDLEKAAGRRPAQSMQLQLASVWTREGRHDRAGASYRDLLAADNQSVSGWSGYITALHNAGQDYTALDEAQRMPAAVRTTLLSDSNFIRLLGSIQAAAGNNDQAVDLLQQARARYRVAGQPTPVDLDVQLGWTMMGGRKYANEVPAFLDEIRKRTDLASEHRAALDEIAAAWTVRTAEQAMRAQQPARAVAVLTNAAREQPGNARIRSALASVYLRQQEYDRALELYRLGGMSGASAADYRAAAGVAMSAHRGVVVEKLLWEGRQRWPNDPELLHMTAMQALSREDYKGTEHYLEAALAALRKGQSASAPRMSSTFVEARGLRKPAPAANVIPASALGEPSCQPDLPSGSAAAHGAARVVQGRDADRAAVPDDHQITARQIQSELDAVRSRNAPSIGIGSPFTARLGDPGVNRLIVRDSVASSSFTVLNAVRVAIDAHQLDLDSGTPDGRSGYRFGSLARGATFDAQRTFGWAGELQASGDRFGVAFGLLPKEFLVQNWTGGFRVGSPDGSLRFIAAREAVKDSLLSYAGARDPDTGIVWGGVVSDSGTVQFSHDTSGGGQYASVGASALHGTNVADNWSAQATAGAYWRVIKTDHGALSVGVNVTGMHYEKNLNFFSLGHGGYFSPQRYLLGSVPVSWFERRNRLEYEVAASGGVQTIIQDGAPFDPTRSDSLEPPYDPDTRRGGNYNLAFRLAYRIAPHLYLETFAGGNNARDFASRSFQISLKWFLSLAPSGTHLPVKAVPDWRGTRPTRFD